MSDAAAQLRRLLQIIPRLDDGKPHTLASVAQLAHTEPRVVLRDLLALSNRLGDPGGFVPGLQIFIEGRGSVSVHAPQFRRPMRLTPMERCALELGLAMLRSERPPDTQRLIDSARERLQRTAVTLPKHDLPDPQRYAALGAVGDSAHFATIRQGVREHRKLRIAYRGAADEESSARTVCPYGLVAARGAWYLVAYSDDRKAIRIFRLDRIEDTTLLAERYELPAEFSLDSMVRDGRVFHGEIAETVTIRYSPRIARWIAEREGVAPAADGSVTVDYPLADTQWALRHVLQYGPDAQVLAPDAARRAVVARLQAIVGRGISDR